MNRYSPYYDPDEHRVRMGLDAEGSWVHVAYVERLTKALEQVLVDINDPHPRTSTLEGFRGAIKSTEAMVLRALARNNAPLVAQETP